ncbi:MAG: hypothetical protein Q8O34_02905 [Rhodocyclaceae bacterium]|nr:hypothetical protein [Rhodocyclaceae bacterium]
MTWLTGCRRPISADFPHFAKQIQREHSACHYVKARVRVNRYASGALALFHGPRGLAYFTPEERPITDDMQQAA